MRNNKKRTGSLAVFYFVSLVVFLLFFFFTNDFGLVDIQKTAIVTAVGIDKDGEDFLLTTQIAVPQASKQGEQVEPVQIESRGKTVAEAFGEVNAKTGWYPKLVFCDVIVLGKTATEKNVFECLDYFLRNEYASDDCLLAATEGTAKEIISATTPIEKISGLAVEKVLSDHSARTGSVLPATLKSFATDYFSDGESGTMPVIRKEALEEGEENVFFASETALFSRGIMVGKLNARQTFALAAVKQKLRLAPYGTENAGSKYTLLVKKNSPKRELHIDERTQTSLKIRLKIVAGEDDVSTPHTVTELGSVGKIPRAVFDAAEKNLREEIESVFETGKQCECDVFDAVKLLKRRERDYYPAYKNDLLSRLSLDVEVKFSPLR